MNKNKMIVIVAGIICGVILALIGYSQSPNILPLTRSGGLLMGVSIVELIKALFLTPPLLPKEISEESEEVSHPPKQIVEEWPNLENSPKDL